MLVLFEENCRYVINGVSDKESGKNINGLMQVPKKYYYSEKDGCQDKYNPESFVIPENQRHEIRKSGVGRKKQISAEDKAVEWIIVTQ